MGGEDSETSSEQEEEEKEEEKAEEERQGADQINLSDSAGRRLDIDDLTAASTGPTNFTKKK